MSDALTICCIDCYVIGSLTYSLNTGKQDNILQRNLFVMLTSDEMVAQSRLLGIIHLPCMLPLRWLAGNTHKLSNYGWGVRSMSRVLNIFYQKIQLIEANPRLVLSEIFMMRIFSELIAELPPFTDYWVHLYRKKKMYQLGGGSSPASIGEHVFDPQMLKISGIATELWRIDDYASDALPLRLASASSVEKIIQSDFDDIGNLSATVVSLVFMRLRSYAVNARVLDWKQRAIYTWATLLWFTSFHTSGSTMLANKRNMLLESVGLLFLLARSDVLHPRRLTSECNEHTYGFWRMMLREFTMEQLIRIVDKSNIRLDAIFESDLVTARSHTSFKGYQHTFPEFLQSLKKGSAGTTGGPVHVDNDMPAVDQLWEEVKGVIEVVNSWMLPFLKVFGVEEGNGLSPFAVTIDKPSDLLALVEQFFKPPKRDNRGNSTLADEDVVAENVDPLDDEDDVEEICTSSNEGTSLPVGVLEHYVDEIRQAAGDDSTDDDLVSGNNEEDAATATEDVCNETFLRRNHRTLLLIILSG